MSEAPAFNPNDLKEIIDKRAAPIEDQARVEEEIAAMSHEIITEAESMTAAAAAENATPKEEEFFNVENPRETVVTDSGNVLTVTRQVFRTKRQQGAPDGATADSGVIELSEPKEVVAPAKPIVTTRTRGGAHRPQGAPAKEATETSVLGGKFSEIQQLTYKNGVKHVYGIDADGKKRHLSYSEILEAYGHAGDQQGKRPAAEAAPVTPDVDQSESSTETAGTAEADLKRNELQEKQKRAAENYNKALTEGSLEDAEKYLAEVGELEDEINALSGGDREVAASQEVVDTDQEAAASVEADAEAAEALSEPVTDLSEDGIRSRLSRRWQKLKDWSFKRGLMAQNGITAVAANRLATPEKRRSTALLVAVAGGALAVGAVYLSHKLGVEASVPKPPQKPGGGAGGHEAVKHLHEILHVQRGSGFEDSLQQQYHLSDAQSHELFQQLRPELKGQPGTYLQGGDLRILQPGNFHMNAQEQHIIEEFLKTSKKSS